MPGETRNTPDSGNPPPKSPRLPKLRGDIKAIPGGDGEDGLPSWIVFDPVADTYFRISERDYRVVALLDREQTLDELLNRLAEQRRVRTREEVMRIVAMLEQGNLLHVSYLKTGEKVRRIRDLQNAMFYQKMLAAYMFFRLPLWSPDRFIRRTAPIVEAAFNRWVLTFFALIAGLGYFGLLLRFHKFTEAFVNSISVRGLVRYSLAILIIKIVHEFAHAYTACHFECRVRRMGIAVVFFVPRFYTDLTDGWRIRDKYKRFTIDGAGIFSEVFTGGFAALVWCNSAPGLAHEIAYYIFAVSIINTVLINGNPFIRYDGYYMLMDMVNIDNLQKRAALMVRDLWRVHLFGLPGSGDPSRGGKRIFLIFFGVCGAIYRVFLYTSIILLVYFNFTKVVGIVLLALELYLLVLKPVLDEGRMIYMNRAKITRVRFFWSFAALALGVLLLTAPLPWNIDAPCEIKSAEAAVVYAPAPGYLAELAVKDGERVTAGKQLMRQRNPFLDWRTAESKADWRIENILFDQSESIHDLLSQIELRKRSLAIARENLAENERRLKMLETTAPISGVFSLHDRRLAPGKFLVKGEVIGEIDNPDKPFVQCYLTEDDVRHVRPGNLATVMLPDRIEAIQGKVTAIRPTPATLPASPLLNVFGGPIMVYVTQTGAYQALTPYYQIDLAVPKHRNFVPGRTGVARFRRYDSVAGNLVRTALRVLRRELSF